MTLILVINYRFTFPISRYDTEFTQVKHKIILHLARTRTQDCHSKHVTYTEYRCPVFQQILESMVVAWQLFWANLLNKHSFSFVVIFWVTFAACHCSQVLQCTVSCCIRLPTPGNGTLCPMELPSLHRNSSSGSLWHIHTILSCSSAQYNLAV